MTRRLSVASAPCVAALFGLTTACGAASVRPGPLALEYTFTLGPALDVMEVHVCSRGRWPESMIPIHAEGARRLRAVTIDGERAPSESPIPTGALAPRSCLELEIDLSPGGPSLVTVARSERGIFAPTSAWLWAPSSRPPDLEVHARFELPEGVVHTPVFSTDDTGLVLDDDSFHFVSYVAFGRFEPEVIAGPDTCVTVGALGPGLETETRRVWIEGALETLAQLGEGVLPPRVSVVLVPVGGAPSPGAPVFGLAAHGTTPSILLVAPSSADRALLLADWALPHELVHLTVPHVAGRGAWLGEGLATYYQEVLRARAGRITAEDAWRALDDGFHRGLRAEGATTLRDASESMHETHDYERIYWSGAAVALLVDLELREHGSSLDAAMARASRMRSRETSDAELARLLDGDREVVGPLVSHWGDSIEPPDLRGAYAALGLVRGPAGLTFLPEGASLRDAIMNPVRPPASERVDCTVATGVSSRPTP